MGSTNITLRDEAYETLKALKRENESFSDVILRLGNRRSKDDVRELAGSIETPNYEERVMNSAREVRKELEDLGDP